jgi:FeS assembly SUF system protein
MPITLSEIAATEIQKIMKEQGLSDSCVLRVGIKGRNSMGFNYLLDLTEALRDDDIAGESRGIKIVADPVSFPSLDGTEIDFKDEAGARGFIFKNPHAVRLPVRPPGPDAAVPAGPAAAGGASSAATITDALRNKVLQAEIIEKLRTIFDPEIPVNIYDLGLIYRIDISGDKEVAIDMTLTAPGCPVAGSMPPAVQQAVQSIDEIKSVKVNLVWDPPWSKDRMSEAAMLELGIF